MRKLTIEFVKDTTQKIAEGYRCLSDKYENAHTKLKFICNSEHQFLMSWASFSSFGSRCPICMRKSSADSSRLTLEYVKNKTKELTDSKYECSSNEYINNKTKLKFICDREHPFLMLWGNFRRGQRCSICVGLKKKTIEYVKTKTKELTNSKYECSSNEYINSKTKLKFICNREHPFLMRWNDFRGGQRCPICANYRKGDILRLTLEHVKSETKEVAQGYECLSSSYKSAHTKLKFICDKDHQFWMEWSNFQQGLRCPKCSIERRSGENHPNWKNYSEEDRKNIKLYKDEVIKLSNINYVKYFCLINPNNLKRERCNGYNLDHIFSIVDGFNNGVLPKIISSPVNLRMLWWSDNLSKNGSSAITIEQLYSLYNQFSKKEGVLHAVCDR